jgi:hypothetical protein
MPDIPIHNETGYDLSPLILEHIKFESIEQFGERIADIRVQLDIERHAFNTKTREVRFAFSPFDYGFSEQIAPASKEAAHNLYLASLHDDSTDLILSDYIDEGDETDFAMLDDMLEVPESDDQSVLREFNADYYAIETGEPDSFSTDDTEHGHYER